MRTTFEDSICYKQNRMSAWIMITIMLIDIVFFVIAFSTKETDENNEKKFTTLGITLISIATIITIVYAVVYISCLLSLQNEGKRLVEHLHKIGTGEKW